MNEPQVRDALAEKMALKTAAWAEKEARCLKLLRDGMRVMEVARALGVNQKWVAKVRNRARGGA